MNGGQDRLVLIVEDNDKNLKLARDVLRYHGFRTLEAVRGEDALPLARQHQPDIILMDVALPGIDGVEATRRVKADAATADIAVVALTASIMQSDRSRFEQAGFSGLIAKPIDVLTFAATVLAFCPVPGERG
jgi:two-component system, cell cycle response regulator DivK